MKIAYPSLCLLLSIIMLVDGVLAQDKKAAKTDSLPTARVEVTIVNGSNQPRKGELVLFTATKKLKKFSQHIQMLRVRPPRRYQQEMITP